LYRSLVPGYPVSATDTRVDAAELRARVTRIFANCSMSEADAALLADTLVLADLRGVHSHGVLRVPEYVKKLRTGGVDPTARPFVARSVFDTCAVVDGNNAMGQIACQFAAQEAMARATKHGIGAVAVRGSNHCGALFYFAMQLAAHDMIGILSTNALPTMAPWGGREKILGINPMAFALPAAEEPPIVFDAAFSASSHGKIRVYQQKNQPLPDGWAFDKDGHPTNDPAAAIEGLLQPIGGFKGIGLSVISGMLSSLLSGAAYGTELGNMVDGPRPGQDGQFVLAIRIDAFEEPARFRARVDEAIRRIRNCAPAAGYTRCYAPGEPEHELELLYAKEGIPLTADTLAGLN
jgi:LDH2 family malate/lactate/ureidoglycolate dehydrogenase